MNSQPIGKSHAVENLVNFTELILIHHINLANLFYAMYFLWLCLKCIPKLESDTSYEITYEVTSEVWFRMKFRT